MKLKDNRQKEDVSRRKVFFPDARALSSEEVAALSDDAKSFAGECRDRGVWLEIFCPDDNCLAEAERVKLPVFCDNPSGRKDLWLEVFCPDDSCEISAASRLP